MNYLARLKQLESEKNSHYAPDTVLTKPTKAPFGSFVSPSCPRIVENFSYQQKVIAELDRLIDIVAKHHGFTKTDTAHAYEIAHVDADSALVCFRALTAEIGNQIH